MDARTDERIGARSGGRRALRLLSRRPIPRGPLSGGGALPLALLLLALSSVFVFGGDRSQFYRWGHHDFTSAHTLAIAENLSAEHRFAGIIQQKLDLSGEPRYVVYNRFPIGSRALVALALLPFGDDFPRAIRAARLLMLTCFAAAAVFAYFAFARLLGDRRIAAAATLLAFSPYYLLHYGDMVSSEMSTNLFGVMLVFHGMAVFEQEGRFRQLLVRTAAALLLGWHAVALVAPFVLLGLGRELLRGHGRRAIPPRAIAASLRSRPVRRLVAYGAFSALCCALLLGFNFGAEYLALNGEVPLHDLPSFRSMLRRSGLDTAWSAVGAIGWATFLRGLLGGIGATALPYAAVDRLGLDLTQRNGFWPPPSVAPWFAALGAAVLAACFAGLRFLRHRVLFAALLLTGWCWALLFRESVSAHETEAMFFVGFPLVLFALALLGLRRLLGSRRAARALPAAAIAAGAVFALSAWDMARFGHGDEAAQRQREAASDFREIRRIVAGGSVVTPHLPYGVLGLPRWGASFGQLYYLAGSFQQFAHIRSEADWRRVSGLHDFVILSADLGGSLTPQNRVAFLYTPGALSAVRASYAAREPSLRAAYDLHLEGRTLTAVRDPCGVGGGPPFFLEAAPPGARTGERSELAFGEHGAVFGGACLARFELPDGPLAGLRVGQRQGDLPPVWEASLPVEDASFPRGASVWRETATASEPAARGPFEVYRDGRTLTFVRDGCVTDDIEARFFVHVHDGDGARENLDFWFHERGARWDGTCMAAVELPDGDVRSVRTGQYDGPVHLWDEEFALDAEAWLARFASFAAREPSLRGAFDAHLEGRALTLARRECSAADVADRFFVHVHPADGGGREAINFWFRERGLRHGDRCMATVALPDYAIDRVAFGQYDASGHLWETEIALGE